MFSLYKAFGMTSIAVLDFETTGLDPRNDYPTEIGIVKIGFEVGGEHEQWTPYRKEFSSKIKLPIFYKIPEEITKLTGLTTDKVNKEGRSIYELTTEVHDLLDENTLVVAHNANFDLGFLLYHFGIKPKHFICTRTVEILTNPHENASLKYAFQRRFPFMDRNQTHRALDDCNMTMDVLNSQLIEHGNEAFTFFIDKMVDMPDRPLVYTPKNAKVLDFSKKFQRKEERE